MGKILALALPDLANGFRLAGLDTHAVRSQEDTYQTLRRAVDGRTHELIILPQEHFAQFDERQRKELDHLVDQVVVPVPMSNFSEQPSPRNFVSELVRRAIGFQIKV